MSLYIAEHLRTGAIELVFMDENLVLHYYSPGMDEYITFDIHEVKGWVFKRLEVL